MFEIFKSEFQRYRKWAFLATMALLACYSFLAKLKPFLKTDPAQTAITYMLLVGGALIFGFVQMLLHRRANHWTYLIHRPLAPQQIFTGVTLAGAAVIAMVLFVPWLTMVGGIDAFTATAVDMRHYTYILFVFLCCLTAYLVGTLSAMNPSKGSILLAIILLLTMNPKPQNDLLQYAPMIISVAVLFLLNLISFKPDLSTYVKRPWAMFLMVLPMSYALVYGLTLSTTFYYHVPRMIMGTHPDDNPQDGTLRYLWTLEGSDQIDYALEGSDHPRRDYYVKQSELADLTYFDATTWTYPRQGQLHSLDTQYAFVDKETNTTWQFSHDEMMMVGYSRSGKGMVGAIGIRGFIDNPATATEADRFTDVPFMVGDKFLATKNVIYQVNFKERRLDIKHQPPAGEQYIAHPQVQENYVAVVTNKRSLLFDPRVLEEDYEVGEPDYNIAHPVPVDNFSFVDTYRLVDGYLMLYRGNHLFGFDKPGTVVLHAKLGGETELIYERHFDLYPHPSWIRHYMEMISPVLYLLDSAYLTALEPGQPDYQTPKALIERDYPPIVYWLAAIIMVFSGLAAFVASRWHRLNRSETISWVLMCSLFSAPALVAFFLMNPLRPEPRA